MVPGTNTRASISTIFCVTLLSIQSQTIQSDTTTVQRNLASITSSILTSHLPKAKYRRKKQRSLIIGGETAPPGRFPYIVSLQSERVLEASDTNESNEQIVDTPVCGGTLIAKDVVLTAAHCGYATDAASGGVNFGETPRQIFEGADVGAYDLTNNYGGEGYTVDNMLFERLILHPAFTGMGRSTTMNGGSINDSGTALQHDVMVVKLYGSSDNPTVRIHNPDVDRGPIDSESMVVVGFGDTDPIPGESNSQMSSILKAANVRYVTNDVCELSSGYSNIHNSASASNLEDYFEYDGTITGDMMCALGEENQDACQGDSGGGLFRLGSDFESDLQLGIVSWGLQCGDEDFPGVYARVGEHFEWIRDTVCEISDDPPGYFGCPIKPLPPGNPEDPIVNIVVSFRLDDYRAESGWVLESMPDFRNIRYRPFGTYKSKNTVDYYNSFSEPISVQSGRFYMLSVLDEFADGFCCSVGEGYFKIEYADRNGMSNGVPIVDTTPGILWTPHALRRAFYVSPPGVTNPPNYVSVVVTLGMGADPGKLLLVALENMEYEALMLYEIRPFIGVNFDSSRVSSTGTVIYTKTFKVPVFGAAFNRQRYNIMVVDDNDDSLPKTSFEVYLGAIRPKNLIMRQTGDYGEGNNDASRSFVLFKSAVNGKSSLGEGVSIEGSRVDITSGTSPVTTCYQLTLLGSFIFFMSLL